MLLKKLNIIKNKIVPPHCSSSKKLDSSLLPLQQAALYHWLIHQCN